MVRPYISHVTLSTENPDWAEWLHEEGDSQDAFDHWCNWELNLLVDDLEENGASCIVLSLEEYRTLPKY